MEEHIEVIRPGEFVAPLEEGMPADVFFRYVPQAPAEQAEEQVIEDHRELSEEERHGTVSQGTGPGEGCTADATQEVPDQLTNDVLENLQADIGEKLQVQEEAFSARNHRLKNTSSK
ncbi:hypothetical protein AAFF_G00025430 [Aldrovandia affinis]|uniref:Uncharacterized protein n=1 Tax=Aldrovandia affinis TaxID=143900 RepID=A0AAD7WG98_9TELE|nr:hypothetical protein AAFF_G00025430 [Aldrovandia affinis]